MPSTVSGSSAASPKPRSASLFTSQKENIPLSSNMSNLNPPSYRRAPSISTEYSSYTPFTQFSLPFAPQPPPQKPTPTFSIPLTNTDKTTTTSGLSARTLTTSSYTSGGIDPALLKERQRLEKRWRELQRGALQGAGAGISANSREKDKPATTGFYTPRSDYASHSAQNSPRATQKSSKAEKAPETARNNPAQVFTWDIPSQNKENEAKPNEMECEFPSAKDKENKPINGHNNANRGEMDQTQNSSINQPKSVDSEMEEKTKNNESSVSNGSSDSVSASSYESNLQRFLAEENARKRTAGAASGNYYGMKYSRYSRMKMNVGAAADPKAGGLASGAAPAAGVPPTKPVNYKDFASLDPEKAKEMWKSMGDEVEKRWKQWENKVGGKEKDGSNVGQNQEKSQSQQQQQSEQQQNQPQNASEKVESEKVEIGSINFGRRDTGYSFTNVAKDDFRGLHQRQPSNSNAAANSHTNTNSTGTTSSTSTSHSVPLTRAPSTHSHSSQSQPLSNPFSLPTSIFSTFSCMSVRELKHQLINWGISLKSSDILEKKDLFYRVCQAWHEREQARKRRQQAEKEEKEREAAKERITQEMERRTAGKSLHQLMNEILGYTSRQEEYLTKHSSLDTMKKAYKRVVLKIHPDKLTNEGYEKQLRGTELFKLFIELWSEYKKKHGE